MQPGHIVGLVSEIHTEMSTARWTRKFDHQFNDTINTLIIVFRQNPEVPTCKNKNKH